MKPVSRLRLSDRGFDVLHEREGMRLEAYQDSVGTWSICLGHTSAAGPPDVVEGMTCTEDQCEMIFRDDSDTFDAECRHLVTVPLEQWQYDATCSFLYNIGSTNFASSTFLQRLNEGDYHGAGEAMLMWNKPPEIMDRRRGEYYQFMDGIYVARMDENGRPC